MTRVSIGLAVLAAACTDWSGPGRTPVRAPIDQLFVVSALGADRPIRVGLLYGLINSCHAAGRVEFERDGDRITIRAMSLRDDDASGCRELYAQVPDTVEVSPPFGSVVTIESPDAPDSLRRVVNFGDRSGTPN